MSTLHPDFPLSAAEEIVPGACHSWRQRLTAHGTYKIVLLLTIPVIFKSLYLACQHAPHLMPRHWPLTWIDHAIRFDPSWTWTYLSIYLLLPLAPFLTTDRTHLTAYTRGITFMSAVAFACFYFLPVEMTRPGDPTSHPAYAALIAIDRPVNCFPSMHVGFAVFTLLHLRRLRRTEWPEMPAHWLSAGWAWVAAIVVSTLVTKQHYLIDLPAGAALACLSDFFGHRWSRTVRRNGKTNQPVSPSPGTKCPVA